MVGGGHEQRRVFCVEAEEALLTVLVLSLYTGRFAWAAPEWMRSSAIHSSRTTSGPLTTYEKVIVCVFFYLSVTLLFFHFYFLSSLAHSSAPFNLGL